jgi:hypothetical protein
MLILSKFQDYYDSAIGYGGIDKSIIYKRKEKLIEYPKNKFTNVYNKYFKFFDNLDIHLVDHSCNFNFNYYGVILIICGKIYSCVKLNLKNEYGYDSNYICFYNLDEMGKYIKDNFNKKDYKNFIKEIKQPRFFGYNNLKDFFDIPKRLNLSELQIIDYHRQVNSPIIQYGSYYTRVPNIKLNIKLKPFQFYKVIDSFQMFQTLEMFMSGVIGSGKKPIIEIDDMAKRDKHGFDYKSFKNM